MVIHRYLHRRQEGNFATKYILERHAIKTPPKKEFRDVYGKLHVADNCKIFPLQHPSAVLHNYAIKDILLKNYATSLFCYATASDTLSAH